MPKKGQLKANAKPDSVRQRAYNQSPEQRKRNAERKKARRIMEKAGKVHKFDGKDVDHKNMNTANNNRSNLQVMSASKNRAKNKHHLGKKK